MKLVFLPQSAQSLRWFHQYYAAIFPAGNAKAMIRFSAMKETLRNNPNAGHLIEGSTARLLVLPGTPFSVIYRLAEDRIEVLALHDNRSGR